MEPAHLRAAMLSEETAGVGEILKQVGIFREAVLAAIRT
jgi:hypothetical protein